MMALGPPFLRAFATDGGAQAWLVLSSPTGDEAGRLQREPSYLAALLYVSLCPQQAWLNIRSLLPKRSHLLRAFAFQVRSAYSVVLTQT